MRGLVVYWAQDSECRRGGKTTNLEDYFEILAPNDIRVKGRRVGIEAILSEYLDLGLFPEQIPARYPTWTLARRTAERNGNRLMSAVGFLMDERVPPIIRAQLAQMEPQMEVHAIVRVILDDLVLIWAVGRPDGFQDQTVYLPLGR